MPGRRRPGSCCPTAGWSRRPGEQVPVPDLPLNILPLPDSRHALVATSGYNAHELVAGRPREARRSSIARRSGRAGSGWRPRPTSTGSGGRGAAANVVHRFGLDGQQADARGGRPEGRRQRAGAQRARTISAAGWRSTRRARSSTRWTSTTGRSRPSTPTTSEEIKSAPAGTRPYDVALARGGNQLFVSDWAGRAVLVRRPGRPPHDRPDRRRRASQPDRRASRRTTGSSSPVRRATASR